MATKKKPAPPLEATDDHSLWQRGRRDGDGLTTKDRVYRAFLNNHDLTLEQAVAAAPGPRFSSVGKWLRGAKRLWAAGIVEDEEGSVPVATRRMWIEALGQRGRNSDRAPARRRQSVNRQSDPFLRQEVECVAIEETSKHFKALGFTVVSVERDNIGWDLEAIRGPTKLQLEVKGLSSPEICVELTPNEYAKMQEYRDSYWVCVVTNALTMPKLTVFAFSKDVQSWVDQKGRRLEIEERVAARCRVS